MNTKSGRVAKIVRQRKKKYEIVADRLRDSIEDGVYSHKLPGIRILAEELETNPMTLGSAIKLLVAEDLLYRVPRSGTYLKKSNAPAKATIALVVSDVQAPNTSYALSRIGQLAGDLNLNLLYFSHANDPKKEAAIMRTIAKERLASGVIWWPSSVTTGAANQEILVESKVPFVVLEMTWRGIRGGCVLSDFFAGFRTITENLLGKGYKNILFVVDQGSFEADPRYLAYRSVLESNGILCHPAFEVSPADLNERQAVVTPQSRKLAEHFRGYDALICVHDRFGASVYQFLLRHRCSVPEDIALVSFDGLELTELLGITTYRQPMDMIGETALGDLLNLIKNPDATPRRVLLQGGLLERDSTKRKR